MKIGLLDGAGGNIRRLIVLVALIAICSIGAPVYATTINQSLTFGLSDGPKLVDSPFAVGGTLTFDKFDGSLGTLTDLSIDFTGALQATGGATVVNTHPCSGGTGGVPDPSCSDSVSGSLNLTLLTGSLVLPGPLAIPDTPFSGTPSGGDSCTASIPSTNCALSTSGGTATTFHFSDYVGPGSTTLTDTFFLVGPGTFDFLVNAQALFESFASSSAMVTPDNGTLSWTGNAQVSYTYDPAQTVDPLAPPVPEPGTLLLLTMGVIGAGYRMLGSKGH